MARTNFPNIYSPPVTRTAKTGPPFNTATFFGSPKQKVDFIVGIVGRASSSIQNHLNLLDFKV